MRDFACPNCGQRLAFENSVCLSCGSPIGFDLTVSGTSPSLGPDGVTVLEPQPADVREPERRRLQLAGAGRWGRRCAGRAR